MSPVSPQWPMITRERSTPSSARIRCCSRPPRLAASVCVVIGTPVSRCATGRRAQHPLDVRREPRRVDRALQDRGLGAVGPLDPLADVAHEQLDEHVTLLRRSQHVAVVEVLRQLVRREDARRQHDVEVDLLGDALHERRVAPDAQDRRVDDRVDARGLQLGEPPHRVHDGRLLVEVRVEARLEREVDHEDVLVHERRPEPIARDRAARRLDRPHAGQSDAMTSGVACCSPR